MTSWPEQPPTGQPQAQTRRQAREFERSRRAGTAEPTPAGQIPEMTTTAPPREPDQPDAAERETAEPVAGGGQSEPADTGQEAANDGQPTEVEQRPAIPASAFAEPGVSSPSGNAFDLFRQGPDHSRPEPVTQPMAILQPTPPVSASSVSDQQGAAPSAAPSSDARSSDARSSDATSSEAPAAGSERTLTRRELRAMLQAQEANAQANQPSAVGE